MKQTFLIFIALATASHVNGQIIKSVGIKGGISVANQTWNYKAINFTPNKDSRIGFYSAVSLELLQLKYFNLTTGFRSPVFQPLYRYVFFIPMAVAGFHPLHIMFAYTVNQVWGTLVHTKKINILGFLEYFMVTPSHHRVHHASNIRYLDKNMGMVLIIWDKIFGTFEPEDDSYELTKYGLTYPIEDKGPVNIIFHEWKAIYRDASQPNISLSDRLKYIFFNPAWKPLEK